MKRLDRYILQELTVPLLIGTVVIALLFVGNEFIFLFKQFEISHVPPLVLVQLVLFKIPSWLNLTLPVGVAMGASLAISRLAREGELTAIRAAGVSIRRTMVPVVLVAILVAVANFYLVEKIVPKASQANRKLMSEFFLLSAVPKFRSDVVIKLDRYSARFGTVERKEDGTLLLTDIVLFESPKPEEVFIYKSKTGTYRDGVWSFTQPFVYNLVGTNLIAGKSRKEVVINEKLQIADIFVPPDPAEETAETLRQRIREARAIGKLSTIFEIAFYVKYTIPASCVVFAITSALMAIRLARSGAFVGVLVSLGLVIVYYNIHVISTEIIGRNGWLPPMWAAWLPNILYVGLALLLGRRLE